MKLPQLDIEPLTNKAKANKFALWRTFSHIGQSALFSVIAGRITADKAHEHLLMLRKMLLEDATGESVLKHLKLNGMIKSNDEVTLEYYGITENESEIDPSRRRKQASRSKGL